MQLPTGTGLFQPDHYYSGVGGRVGIGELDNKANSVQLQLPTGTELGNNLCVHKNKSQIFSFQKLLFLYEKEQITS